MQNFADELSQFYKCNNYQSINIEKLVSGHDVIAVNLNGVNSKFIIDTGAKMTVINERLISKYNIKQDSFIKTEEAAGAAGFINIKIYDLKDLKIGNQKIHINEVASTDLTQVINGLGFTSGVWVDGIIGQDVLLAHAGIIDNPNNKLLLKASPNHEESCISDYKKVLENSNYQAINIKLLNIGLATLQMTINNESGEFILDSGARGTMINTESLKQFQFNDASVVDSRQSAGAGGAITLKTIKLDSLKINSISYAIPTIYSLDLSDVIEGIKSRSQADVHGVLGQDILQKYSSIISFYDNTVYLKPD